MDLRTARRLAAAILGVGESRIVFAPEKLKEIRDAITRDDIRALIKTHAITAVPAKGVSRARARLRAARRAKGRARGRGKIKGGRQVLRKAKWIARIRAQRKLLKKLKKEGKIVAGYRETYLKIKGGVFKDKAHLLTFLKERGYLREGAERVKGEKFPEEKIKSEGEG